MSEERDRLAEQLSAYLDGELDAPERDELEARLESDDEARRLLDELRALSEALGEDAPPEMPEALLPRIHEALENHGAGAERTRPRVPIWRRPPWIAGAAAAAACVVAAVVVHNLPPDERLLPPSAEQVAEESLRPSERPQGDRPAPADEEQGQPDSPELEIVFGDPESPGDAEPRSKEQPPGEDAGAGPEQADPEGTETAAADREAVPKGASSPRRERAGEPADGSKKPVEPDASAGAEHSAPLLAAKSAERQERREGEDAGAGPEQADPPPLGATPKAFGALTDEPSLPALAQALAGLGCPESPITLTARPGEGRQTWPPSDETLRELARQLDGALASADRQPHPILVIPGSRSPDLRRRLRELGARLDDTPPADLDRRCLVVAFEPPR